MIRILSLIYEDLLNFHFQALRYFKQKMWKQLFHALWRSFDSDFAAILRNLRAHKDLLESQASLAEFSELIRTQELARQVLDATTHNELHRRRNIVNQWLSTANYLADQETFQNIIRENTTSGKWLLRHNRFRSWFDPLACSTPLLWFVGPEHILHMR